MLWMSQIAACNPSSENTKSVVQLQSYVNYMEIHKYSVVQEENLVKAEND